MKEALAHYPFMTLSIVAMLMFLTVFIGTVLWTFRKGSQNIYDKTQLLPLEGETNV